MKKKLLTMLLCLGLLAVLFAGCAGDRSAPEPTAAPTEGPAAASTPEPETSPEAQEPASGETDPAQAEEDYQAIVRQLLAARGKIDPQTVICTIDGQDVTWGEFFYFISGDLQDVIYYTGGLPVDYDEPLTDEASLGDYFRRSAQSQAVYYAVANSRAAENGVTLSPETETAIEEYWSRLVESYGGEEALRDAMEEARLNEDLLRFFLRSNELLSALKDKLYGAGGERLSDEEVLSWGRENGYLRTKHILYYFYNEDGTPMDEEGKAAQKERAEASLAELRALAEDPQALERRFDEIMKADSGDGGGLTNFPDGYTFTTGNMTPNYEEASLALEEYALSDVVETNYGYHIILRLPMTPEGLTMDQDSGTGAYMTLRESAAAERFNLDLTGWINDAKVEWTDEKYENLDLTDLFDLTPEEKTGE